jgi:hypothetical protein
MYPMAPNAGVGAPSKSFAITSMVLGIISLVSFICCAPLGLLGIGAVVFGVISLRQEKAGQAAGRPMAIAGVVTGAIALVLLLVIFVIFAAHGFNLKQ